MVTQSATPPIRSSEIWIGAGVAATSVAASILTHHWTLLLVPFIWAAITLLSGMPLQRRFGILAASTVLLPRYPLAFGLSVDDIVPSAAAIAAILLLVRWKPPRMPRFIEAAFAIWILAAGASALVNGHSVGGMVKLAAPGIGRPVFWFLFTWTSQAIVRRGGIKMLLLPVAAVAIVQSIFVAGTYARCSEIHLGAVSQPENRQVWEERRGLGVEQGAGTNVGEQRIRCRATGTLGQSSNFLAAFLVTAIPATVGAALFARGRVRWLYSAGAALTIVALFLTFTRAALPAAALAIFLTLLFAAPRRALPAFLIAGVLVVIVAGTIPQVRKRLTDDKADRLALWYSGGLIFADHPFLGVGFGNYRKVQLGNPKYLHTPYGEPTSTAHNGFIGIAAEGGIFQAGAVLTLAVAFVVAGARGAKRARGTPDAGLIAAAFGGLCGFLAQNMTNTLLLVPTVATYYWIFGGVALGALALRGAAETPAAITQDAR